MDVPFSKNVHGIALHSGPTIAQDAEQEGSRTTTAVVWKT